MGYILLYKLKECQKWNEHIENTKMAEFEVSSVKRISLGWPHSQGGLGHI